MNYGYGIFWAITFFCLSLLSAQLTSASTAHERRLSTLRKKEAKLKEQSKCVRLLIESLENQIEGTQRTTSIGFVFSVVQHEVFGTALRSPDGTIWSGLVGEHALDRTDYWFSSDKERASLRESKTAEEACRAIGGRLPTRGDFQRLISCFPSQEGDLTAEGKAEIHEFFPDMKKSHFWTSSESPPATGWGNDGIPAYDYFDAHSGGIRSTEGRKQLGVLCIGT